MLAVQGRSTKPRIASSSPTQSVGTNVVSISQKVTLSFNFNALNDFNGSGGGI
jgi:hypothetical protein